MSGSEPTLAELRARLYRLGATAEDLARYEAAVAALPPPPVPVPEDAPSIPVQGRGASRRLLLIGGGVVALGGAAAVVGLAAAPRASLAQLGAGASGVRPGSAAGVAGSLRAAFVRALERGRPAGLTPWLALDDDDDAPIDEFHGTGSGGAELLAPIAATQRRTVTVAAVVATEAPIIWRVARLAQDDDGEIVLRTILLRGAVQPAGDPALAQLTYGAIGRPIRLDVTTTPGTRWGVALAYR